MENIKKRPIFAADAVVATLTTFATNLVLRVDLVEVKRLNDTAGKIKKLTDFDSSNLH